MVQVTSHRILVAIRGLGGGLRSPSGLRFPSGSSYYYHYLSLLLLYYCYFIIIIIIIIITITSMRRLCFRLCLLVGLFVSRITRKVMNGFRLNFQDGSVVILGTNH